MRISAKAEYACLALLALAQDRGESPMRIREIAESQSIPERYLVQILLQLKGAGLVASTRGAAGGYRLARSPELISIREILTAIDGPEENREAAGRGAQVLALVWDEVREAEQEVLGRIRLSDLAAQVAPREWVI